MSNYPVEMDQEIARHLFERCAVLIIAGVPKETEFGLDLSSFQVDTNFRGVKMIPEGPHYIYCASKGAYGDTAPRVGLLHYFKAGEIFIREWDNEKEELRERKEDLVKLETERIRENLKDLDRYLAPYDFEQYNKWKCLTNHITDDDIQKLMPSCGLVRTAVEYLSCPDSDRPRGGISSPPRLRPVRSIADEDDLLPDLQPIPGTNPNFTKLPKINTKTTKPSEISFNHMDSINLVDSLVKDGGRELMSEIQFSFILFMCGHSTDALAHWRRILAILCNSETAVAKYKDFYKDYLVTMQYQLVELPIELMEPTKNNSVYLDVRKLLANCIASGPNRHGEHLQKQLQEKMSWTFPGLFDEDPEDLPVVVEM